MINCDETTKLISMYIDDEIDDNIRSEFEKHIDGCEACKKELLDTLKTINLIKGIGDSELPEGFKSELHNKLCAIKINENKFKSLNFFNKRYVKIVSGIAAGMLVFIFAWGVNEVSNNNKSSYDNYASSKSETEKFKFNEQFSAMKNDTQQYLENGSGRAYNTDSATSSKASTDGDVTTNNSYESKASGNSGIKNSGTKELEEENSTDNNAGIKGITCSPKPKVQLLNSINITIRSIDFKQTYDKVENVSMKFNAKITESNNVDYIYLRVLNSNYGSFITSLSEAFISSDVKFGTKDSKDQTSIINDYENKIENINKNISSLEKDLKSNVVEIQELQSQRDELTSGLKKLKDDINYTSIYIYLTN